MDRFNARLAALIVAGLFTAQAAQADLIQPIGAEASSEWISLSHGIVEHAINGNGLVGTGITAVHTNGWPHGGSSATQWHTQSHPLGNPTGQWISFDLGSHYNLTSIVVWNFSAETPGEDATPRGFKDFNLIASHNDVFGDGDDIVINGLVLSKVNADRAKEAFAPAQILNIDAQNVRYVRLNPLTNFGAAYTGLAEVRFEGAPVPEPASLALLGLGATLMMRRRTA